MRKTRVVRLLAGALATVTLVANTPCTTVLADSQRIITLGADLSEEQKSQVLKFFGVSADDATIDWVTVNNAEEHETLDNVLPSSVIGKKTYSCAYIEPTTSGGINVKTANLNYVTVSSLYNALQTAGIENCNLIVTAPFEVSGTGALTGVFKAFEETGQEIDTDKQQAAAEELVTGSQLEEKYGEESSKMIGDIKEEVVSSSDDLSDEEVSEVITKQAEKHGIELSDEDKQSISDLMEKVQGIEYDKDAFSKKLDDVTDTVKKLADEATKTNEETKGVLAKIESWFESIKEFFVNLLGGSTAEEDTDKVVDEQPSENSIFDNVDTSVYQYDTEQPSEEGSTEQPSTNELQPSTNEVTQ